MIKKENNQNSFYGMLWRTLLPKDHELLRIKKEFDFSWLDEELKGFYRENGTFSSSNLVFLRFQD